MLNSSIVFTAPWNIELIQQQTNHYGVSTYIDASGSPQAVASSLPYVTPYGEVILRGSPRGQYQVNLKYPLQN